MILIISSEFYLIMISLLDYNILYSHNDRHNNYSYNSISALVKECVTSNMVASKHNRSCVKCIVLCTLMGMLSLVPKPHHSAREEGSGDHCTVPWCCALVCRPRIHEYTVA